MCSIPSRVPLPPRNKMIKTIPTASKPSSLIMKPTKGFLKPSASQGKMVPLSSPILQKRTSSNRSPSVGCSKSSSSSLTLENFSSDNSKTHEVRIRIFSNYGHPSLISCSEIDVLNEKRQTIPISTIKIEPKRNAPNNILIESSNRRSLTRSRSETNLNLNDFSKLTNGSIMEKNESEYWHAEWPPQFPMKYIDVVVIVKTSSQIDSLRIWPNKFDTSQNFKHVSIFLDQNLLYDNDELANEFGIVIPLQMFDMEGKSRIIGSRQQIHVSDDFGILPVKAINDIEIGFLQSYSSKAYFGLQQIILFDSEGDAIDLESKGLIQCFNCGNDSAKDVKSIFSNNEPAYNFKWIGELNKDSKISIKFADDIIISAVAFVTLPENAEQISLGVKQIKIKFNGFNVWCGMINRGYPESEKAKERTHFIFLYDNSAIKEKVYKHSYKSSFFN